MMIPMTVRSNYMVDGVPHARVVHHLPHRRPVRRGKRTPQYLQPEVGYATIARTGKR
jgi:hypothetical protein